MKQPGEDGAIFHRLQVKVSTAELRRQLGYPRAHNPAPPVVERMRAMSQLARDLLDPRGALRLIDARQADCLGMPRAHDLLAIAVCTIGGRLEVESTRRAAGGSLLDALILDAYGSAAAAADQLNGLICQAAARLGRHAVRRFSPGYAGWDIRRQAELLRLLPAAEIGVTLSEGLMMASKSVSFAVGLVAPDGGAQPDSSGSRCASCSLRSCPQRAPPGERR